MVRNPKKISLDTNLTEWLSKFEDALLEGKDKTQVW